MDTSLTSAPTQIVTDRDRLIGRLAWIGAWCALVIGQLHALARYRTDDGKSDLDLPLTRAWADPAGDLLSPLLTWASPDTVYLTYGKLWLPIFLAFTAAALVVYRHRRPHGFEKWAWRVVLVAYVGACVSVAAEYWTQWGHGNDSLLSAVFLATLPFLVVTMLGSTVLGTTLLVKRYRPTLPAVLLTLALPGALLIPEVTSLGNIVLPIAFAFGLLGRRMAHSTPTAPLARQSSPS
jgi:hypothetical protein